MIRSVVVLPLPDGPSSAMISPPATESDRLSTAAGWSGAKRFETSRSERSSTVSRLRSSRLSSHSGVRLTAQELSTT